MAKLLKTLGTGQGYLKAGFLGFPKSGKTYTATLLAIAAMKHFGIEGPIAMFDTEGGSEYIAKTVKELTGNDLLGVRSRSFQELLNVAAECESEGVQVFLVDSVTHVWRELCEAYLVKINQQRKSRNQRPRTRLEFQDWNPIKNTWGKWTDWYLNSKVHVIICGRAGFEYDFDVNDETGRKELVKTGIKMKTETEFGFEPSLLVEMEREQNRTGKIQLTHRAIVLGDRFGLIDGCSQEFKSIRNKKQQELKAVHEFFKPHLESLTPGSHAPVDTNIKSDLDVDEDGNAEWQREKRERTILAEEIKGELLRIHPGQSSADKVAKAELLELAFGTRSWTKVENTNSSKLRDGLLVLREEISSRRAKEFERDVIDKEPEPLGNNNDDTPIDKLLDMAIATYIIDNQKSIPKGWEIDKDLWRAAAMENGQTLKSVTGIKGFNSHIPLEKVLKEVA